MGSHALVDGDERLAWLAATVFLDVNGYRTGLDDEAAFDLVMGAAATDLGVQEIAVRLDVRKGLGGEPRSADPPTS